MNVCNHDCLNCLHADCIDDDITQQEISDIEDNDKAIRYDEAYDRARLKGNVKVFLYVHSDKKKEAYKRYMQSEKGKARTYRFNHSEKGKGTRKRYLESEKGKAYLKNKVVKARESGKSAEYSKKYYATHRETILEKHKLKRELGLAKKIDYTEYSRKYREAHREEINAKAREKYRLKKLALLTDE